MASIPISLVTELPNDNCVQTLHYNELGHSHNDLGLFNALEVMIILYYTSMHVSNNVSIEW